MTNENEIIKKIKKIEYKIKQKTNNLFLGEYHSYFKKTGIEFSEIRPYQIGDDIKRIDWNKSACYNETYIKIFDEEQALNIILLIDISNSLNFATRKQSKKNTIIDISSILAWYAIKHNDKVGLILFSNKIYEIIPPQKTKKFILKIIKKIIEHQSIPSSTNFDYIFKYLLKIIKKRSIILTFSDFYDFNHNNSLKILCKKHEVIFIHFFDEKEDNYQDFGLIQIKNPEKNEIEFFNSSNKENLMKLHNNFIKQKKNIENISHKYLFSYYCIPNDMNYAQLLSKIFNKSKKSIVHY